MGPPLLYKAEGKRQGRWKKRIIRVMMAALAHPPGCVRSTEQSLCPELRFERSGKTATFQIRSIPSLKKFQAVVGTSASRNDSYSPKILYFLLTAEPFNWIRFEKTRFI
jgi:hypothetical protein